VLRYSALIFLAELLAHGADHLRRGIDAMTPQVFWAGTGLAILGLMAIALILRRHLLAPMFAIDGLSNGLRARGVAPFATLEHVQ